MLQARHTFTSRANAATGIGQARISHCPLMVHTTANGQSSMTATGRNALARLVTLYVLCRHCKSMTEQEFARLRWVRQRIARIHRLQRRLTKALAPLDIEQGLLAVREWEHSHSYKLCKRAKDFTERDAEQLTSIVQAMFSRH